MPGERRLRYRSGNTVDAQCDRRVAALAAGEWGVLDLDELRACGLTRRAIVVRVRRGQLHRMHERVYAVGHANPPWHGRLLAAVKACGPTAAISHQSAAMLWGFNDIDEERVIDVTIVGAGTRLHHGLKVHRTADLPPRDRIRVQGIPVISPARTLLDIAAFLPDQALRSAVRRAQGLRRVNLRQIAETIDRLRPRKGSRRLARVIARGPAPTQSVLEDVVLDMLLAGGLAHPDVNKAIVVGGRRLIPDFRWPSQHLILEADGAAWHDEKVAREDDAERQAWLEAHGERVLRVTWQQATEGRPQTLKRIRAAGAPAAE